jgi:hypothetical protein
MAKGSLPACYSASTKIWGSRVWASRPPLFSNGELWPFFHVSCDALVGLRV